MSQPIPTTAPANRAEDYNPFPAVSASAVKPLAHLLRPNATAPQLDLDALDFFAPGSKAQTAPGLPVSREVEPTAGDMVPTVSASESSFGSSILSRAHLHLGAPNEPADGVKLLKPRLLVLRGERIDVQYTIYPGKNYMGRTDNKPVDIDLENQEPPDRIWSSRQHAAINFENGQITLEDLGSLNGTFVNRTRIEANKPKLLQENDVVQIGTVQLKLILA